MAESEEKTRPFGGPGGLGSIDEPMDVAEVLQAEGTSTIKGGSRYSTLKFVGNVQSFMGWLYALTGAALIVGGIVAATGRNKPVYLIASAAGLVMIFFSLSAIALGQLFSCFVSIERNTHMTAQLVTRLIDRK